MALFRTLQRRPVCAAVRVAPYPDSNQLSPNYFFNRLLGNTLRIIFYLALSLSVFSSGCSIKFAYNNADRFIRWETSDYVRMNSAQRSYFDAEIATLLYWHRTTQLLDYAQFCDEFAAAVAGGITNEQWQRFTSRGEAYGDVLEARMIPIAVQILLSLDARQRERLPRNLAQVNKEFAEDELGKTPEQARLRWTKELRDFFQRFAGRMTSEQWQQVQRLASGYQPYLEAWVAYRERWQSALLGLLDQQLEPAAFAGEFARLSAARESYYGEFGPVFDANEVIGTDIGLWLLNNLTARQQTKLVESMADLAQDFRELAAEAAPAPPAPAVCLYPLRDCPGLAREPGA